MQEALKERKKRDISKKREAILNGATEVFIEYGFEVASMDKIAEVANVSKRTIYNHFPSKEVLFQAIVAEFLKQSYELKPICYSNELPLYEQLREFANAELYLIDDPVRRGLSKLLTATFLMDIEFGKATRGQYKPHADFIAWLNDAKADGRIDFESPEIVARMFYGMIEGCLTWGALFSDGENLKAAEPVLEEIIRVFLACYAR
jgi:TetR/AcrR family transcriptional regulator of autoinduction and epiphytic fitness